MPRPSRRAAIEAIEKLGACLVFPVGNAREPVSLWSHFHPRTPMRWEWDSDADNRVVAMWHLREEISRSGKVAYTKWYRGRATFFSLELFSALVRLLSRGEDLDLGEEAARLYQCFEESSPLSTKEVKACADLRGRANERAFERGMKELWSRLVIVGFGEKQDGAFPSLLAGASKWLLPEAWSRGRAMTETEAWEVVDRLLPPGGAFRRQLERELAAFRPSGR